MPRTLVLAVALSGLLAACGDDSSSDAGDTGVTDSSMDSGPVDSGMRCDPPCNMGQGCCGGEGEPRMCINVIEDPVNCGGCDIVCAEGRGTSCERGNCVCGRVAMGCLGTERSTCCPPRNPGGIEYCADFTSSSQDCGGCDQQCAPEVSSDCVLGECVCGDSASGCAGTPEDTCCPSAVGVYACIDTRSDVFHCGGCGRNCELDERCELGTCGTGASCAEACEVGQICCDGVCCERLSCMRGEC